MDEKDLEMARLKGRLEGMQAAKDTRVNPGRILAWLVLGGLALFLAVLVAGSLVPKESDEARAQRIAAGINAACDVKWTKTEQAAAECRARELQRRASEGLK